MGPSHELAQLCESFSPDVLQKGMKKRKEKGQTVSSGFDKQIVNKCVCNLELFQFVQWLLIMTLSFQVNLIWITHRNTLAVAPISPCKGQIWRLLIASCFSCFCFQQRHLCVN